jgi:aminoglycoside 3-N-acetyltransferase
MAVEQLTCRIGAKKHERRNVKKVNLFRDADDSWITTETMLRLLESVGAADARILYIHSAISFGAPNPDLRRNVLLSEMYQVLAALNVPNICVPTFTFSFCNGEDYSVQTSRSRMGAFNEYVRRLPEARRSNDPLLSSTLIGDDQDLVTPASRDSIGEGSTFDKLHQRGKGVKFLFMGTTVSECLTYSHYVEERLNVPYRYNRAFTGSITDGERTWQDTSQLFVRYKGVVPSSRGMLEKELLGSGLLRKVVCGASSIACVSEPDAYGTIVAHLSADISCYLEADPGDRNTEFSVSNMVAL